MFCGCGLALLSAEIPQRTGECRKGCEAGSRWELGGGARDSAAVEAKRRDDTEDAPSA